MMMMHNFTLSLWIKLYYTELLLHFLTSSVLILIIVILLQSVSCSCNLQAGFTSAVVGELQSFRVQLALYYACMPVTLFSLEFHPIFHRPEYTSCLFLPLTPVKISPLWPHRMQSSTCFRYRHYHSEPSSSSLFLSSAFCFLPSFIVSQ